MLSETTCRPTTESLLLVALGALLLLPGCLGVWPRDWQAWRDRHPNSAGADTGGTIDADGDGFAPPDDCDDDDPAMHPEASEVCDSVDNDCDGTVDEEDAADAPTWYVDTDGDGYGGPLSAVVACAQPEGYAATADDCDDGDAAVHPGATELCDGVDNDCDDTVDEGDATDASTWYPDADGDGYGLTSAGITACTQPTGYLATPGDCDDEEADVNPDAAEVFNGRDDDCDGVGEDCVARVFGGATYDTIQEAIDAAPTGGLVQVCQGRHYENPSITKSLELEGVLGRDLTVLDGSEDGSVIVVTTGNVTIRGFTLENGDNTAGYGGGLYANTTGEVTLEGLLVTGNRAHRGGGVCFWSGSLHLEDVEFSGNTAVDYGGGLALGRSELTASNTTISGNTAVLVGGGVYCESCSMVGDGTLYITNNEAPSGGGFYMTGEPVLSGCVITGNRATSHRGMGGGLMMSVNEGSSGLLESLIVSGNSSTYWAGGMYLCGIDAAFIIDDTLISGNSAVAGGGFAVCCFASVHLDSSSVTSSSGGGALVYAGTLSTTDSDWGTGPSDNDPSDVRIWDGSSYTDFGADETFTCQSSTGTCE